MWAFAAKCELLTAPRRRRPQCSGTTQPCIAVCAMQVTRGATSEVDVSGVVVTGAASGIGRASAEALVADGRSVALWDIAPEVTAVAEGLGMPGGVVDVCDTAAMQSA